MSKWVEAQHPREPEGITTGGQWTKTGRWIGEYTQRFFERGDPDGDDFNPEEIPPELSQPFEDSNTEVVNIYGQAAYAQEGIHILQDENSVARSFYSGVIWPVPVNGVNLGDSPYNLDYLGAADNSGGWGAAAFAEAVRDAIKHKATGMFWSSIGEKSDIFYERIGASHQTAAFNDFWYLTRSQMDALLEAYDAKRVG